MFLRVKHDRKCRKIQTVKSFHELKLKIAELFGPEAEKLFVAYKDSDNEFVSIVDDADLQTCLDEAAELGLTNVTIVLKSKLEGSRSLSSKKSSRGSYTSPSETKSETIVLKEKAVEAMEAEKAKIKADMEKQLAEVNAQAEAKKIVLNHTKAQEISRSLDKNHRAQNATQILKKSSEQSLKEFV